MATRYATKNEIETKFNSYDMILNQNKLANLFGTTKDKAFH